MLEAAAVLGKDVALPFLRALVTLPDPEFHQALAHLQAAEFLLETGITPTRTLTFKHALTQEVASRSILADRRTALHAEAARAIERLAPELVDRTPEVLAHHYTEAGLSAQAITYWHRAGQHAVQRSANTEAVSHLRQGLALLPTLPDDHERARIELLLLLTLGNPLMVLKGYGATSSPRKRSRWPGTRGSRAGPASGLMRRGWVLARQGRPEEGIRPLREGLATWRAYLGLSHFLALLAEAHWAGAQSEAGLNVVDQALAVVDRNSERHYEAELYRLKGELLLQQDAARRDEAALSLQRAIDIARRQQARSLELRAVVSWSRLWQGQKRAEARRMLAEIYGWFTEGFAVADLREAKALLDELA